MSSKPICSLSFNHCIENSFFMVYSFLCKEKEHWNAPMLSLPSCSNSSIWLQYHRRNQIT